MVPSINYSLCSKAHLQQLATTSCVDFVRKAAQHELDSRKSERPMKSTIATFLAALMLCGSFAQVAHAKPKAKTSGLRCTLTELEYWDAPDLDGDEKMIAVRLKCRNGSKTTARVKAHDVYLINSAGDKYSPDRHSDNLDLIYSEEDEEHTPVFVDRFVEFAPGETIELGFVFSGDDGLTDDHLTLDVDGVKYAHTRAANQTKSPFTVFE